jgi:hypothetical protein
VPFLRPPASLCAALVSVLSIPPTIPPHDAPQTQQDFKKYKAVETYEVRPGILMMPRYAPNGQVCEIGLEVRHYSPDLIRHDSLSRKDIDEIAEELAPPAERGAKLPLGADDNELMIASGQGVTRILDYENITIQIYEWVMQSHRNEGVVEQDAAMIRWKHRRCE